MQTTKTNYLGSVQPSDDIGIIFENQEAPPIAKDLTQKPPVNIEQEHKSQTEKVNEFLEAVILLASEHGFKIQTWGVRKSFEKSVSKKYVRQKIKEAVEARDLQLKQTFPQIANLRLEDLPLPEVKH